MIQKGTAMKGLSAILLFMMSEVAFGDQVTVTTYVTRVQEERASTRWTLTEWLRIKERMKLMDVWLAMFSDPAKDRFSPELNVSWLMTSAQMSRKEGGADTMAGVATGHTGQAQFWMTNLVSSSFGVRTLNIDLGVEGGQHDSGNATHLTNTSATASTSTSSVANPVARTTWYTANLRLFGKNIQDSSLIVKYGLVSTKNTWQLPATTDVTTAPYGVDLATGPMAGASLQVYVLHWLGAEGTAHRYFPMSSASGDHKLSGYYGEAMGFVEVSVLRIVAGRYQQQWDASWPNTVTQTREAGYLAGLKLQI